MAIDNQLVIMYFVYVVGIVHENPRIGSDGESEEVSGASDEKDDMMSPVKLRMRTRRYSEVRVGLILGHQHECVLT